MKKAETHAENLANIDPRSILALARIQLRMAQLYEKIGDVGAVNRMQALSSATAETSVNHYAANLKAKPDSLEDLLRLSDSYLSRKNTNWRSDRWILQLPTTCKNGSRRSLPSSNPRFMPPGPGNC